MWRGCVIHNTYTQSLTLCGPTSGESRGALQLKVYEWKGTADIQPLITNPDPIQGQVYASYKYHRASSTLWLSSLLNNA